MGVFGYDSPLMRILNRITDLVVMNVLAMICSIPVFTAGAAMSALHAVCMKMVRGEEGRIVGEFFRVFKRDFKQATPLWLLFLAGAALLSADVMIFRFYEGPFFHVLMITVFACLFILLITFQYAFPLTARYSNRLRDTLKNALLMSVMAFPRTIAMIATDAIVFFLLVMPFSYYILPLVLLIGLSGTVYLKAMLYLPVFERIDERGGREGDAEEEK